MLYNTNWGKQFSSAAVIPDLKYPSVEGYIHLLRNSALWPKDFRWEKHATPSIQLAFAFWPKSVTTQMRYDFDVTQMLSMGITMRSEDGIYSRIFFSREGYREATPLELSDRLEAFLNRTSGTHAVAFAALQALRALRLGC